MIEEEDSPYAKLVKKQLKPLVDAGRITIDNQGTVRMTKAAVDDMLKTRELRDGA